MISCSAKRSLTNCNESMVNRLKTDDGVREAAREEIGFVLIGEERTSVLPTPPLPTELPDGWPYNVVNEIFAARSAGPAPATTD